jgi:glucuronate isomerase
MPILHPDRFFDPDPVQRAVARQLYTCVADLPIVSPHGHVDPRLFADPDARFGSPAELLITPDHYVTRLLHSQGIPLHALGIPARDNSPVESDHRKIWQTFAEYFYLFRGTPSGIWLAHALGEVFGIEEELNAATAQAIYDRLSAQLETSEFRPRALFERFSIEVLCTTDSATDPLEAHRAIRESGWGGQVRPTFRPDVLLNLQSSGWLEQIERLSQSSGIDVCTYTSYIQALEARRSYFKAQGAVAADHAALTPHTETLTPMEAEIIFQRAMQGEVTPSEALRFSGHMLVEMARMSVEDGLVMQLHPGSLRDHSPFVYERFGPDRGGDIPLQTEYTRNLRPLLESFGHDPRLTLVLFTLDETTYTRELAPLAGFYPALRLGPPWWFHDSLNGMRRFFDRVIETAGLYNTAGFNDDTRAFPSIPGRHDLWRRASTNWLASLVVRHILSIETAAEMAVDCAVGLARQTYRLPDPGSDHLRQAEK